MCVCVCDAGLHVLQICYLCHSATTRNSVCTVHSCVGPSQYLAVENQCDDCLVSSLHGASIPVTAKSPISPEGLGSLNIYYYNDYTVRTVMCVWSLFVQQLTLKISLRLCVRFVQV